MPEKPSVCGTICPDCDYYTEDCKGCGSTQGKPFWLQYTRGKICDIYNCCKNVRKHKHCGQCSKLPCRNYEQEDPTKSKTENEESLKNQIKLLKKLSEEERSDS